MPEVIDILFVIIIFMVTGAYLERVGGIDGFWDEFFTPFPLGIIGGAFVLLQWEFAL